MRFCLLLFLTACWLQIAKSSNSYCVGRSLCTPPHYKPYEGGDECDDDEVRCAPVVSQPLSCGKVTQKVEVDKAYPFPHEVPWLAKVTERTADGKEVSLGVASLVHHGAVLTAANIVHGKNASNLVLRLGAYSSESSDESHTRYVDRIVTPPNYSNQHLIQDVAILVLDKPLEVTSSITPICLPQQGLKSENTSCFFAGWNVHRDAMGNVESARVRKVPMYIVPREMCQLSNNETRSWFHLSLSLMCAIGDTIPTQKPCKGDGGGPLFCLQENHMTIVGVASFGSKCEDVNPDMKLSMFTQISKYTDWVDAVLGRLLKDGLAQNL